MSFQKIELYDMLGHMERNSKVIIIKDSIELKEKYMNVMFKGTARDAIETFKREPCPFIQIYVTRYKAKPASIIVIFIKEVIAPTFPI